MLKGETDRVYDQNLPNLEAINWILSRNSYLDSENGASIAFCSAPCAGGALCCGESQVTCPDSLASGTCDLGDNPAGGYKSFSYQVEVCDNNFDAIIGSPSGSFPVSQTTIRPEQTISLGNSNPTAGSTNSGNSQNGGGNCINVTNCQPSIVNVASCNVINDLTGLVLILGLLLRKIL